MKRKSNKVKKVIAFPVYFIHFLIVEAWIGAGIGDVWDKMWKRIDQF